MMQMKVKVLRTAVAVGHIMRFKWPHIYHLPRWILHHLICIDMIKTGEVSCCWLWLGLQPVMWWLTDRNNYKWGQQGISDVIVALCANELWLNRSASKWPTESQLNRGERRVSASGVLMAECRCGCRRSRRCRLPLRHPSVTRGWIWLEERFSPPSTPHPSSAHS